MGNSDYNNKDNTNDEVIDHNELLRFTKKLIDLQEKSNSFECFVDKFTKTEYELLSKLYIDVKYLVEHSETSYLAPAYHFNMYIDNLYKYNLGIINNVDSEKIQIYEKLFKIEVQTIVYSIKVLIDRMVPVFSFYYSGFSLDTTFGRIDESADKVKSSGFMSKVNELKDSDDLMNYVYEEYFSWIKTAVAPRDVITHWNDFSIRYAYPMDGVQIPIHIETKIFNELPEYDVEGNYIFDSDFGYSDLYRILRQMYKFIDTVLLCLSKREVKYRKRHFKDKVYYDSYYSKKDC